MSADREPARVAVIDLGLSNIGSVVNMLKKAGAPAMAVGNPQRLADYDRFVFPGVGAFDRGMERLEASGLRTALEREVMGRGKPILGICLGLQLFCKRSEEGVRPGLGWIDAEMVRFSQASLDGRPLPVLHMGWNEVEVVSREPLFSGEVHVPKYYFLHSYHARCRDGSLVSATCRYGDTFPCALGRKNVMGVQFHPEKSHSFGLRLLKNFCEARF